LPCAGFSGDGGHALVNNGRPCGSCTVAQQVVEDTPRKDGDGMVELERNAAASRADEFAGVYPVALDDASARNGYSASALLVTPPPQGFSQSSFSSKMRTR